MTHVSPSGSTSYPAEKATLDELYRAVQLDRPDVVAGQAADWRKLHTGLGGLVAAIDQHIANVSGSAASRSSDAYLERLREHRDRFDLASRVAESNAGSVETVGAAMDEAGTQIRTQYATWQAARTVAAGLGADETELKKLDEEYDVKAQYTMWRIAGDAKSSADSVQSPNGTTDSAIDFASTTGVNGSSGGSSSGGDNGLSDGGGSASNPPGGATGAPSYGGPGSPHESGGHFRPAGSSGPPELQGVTTVPPTGTSGPATAPPPGTVPPGNLPPGTVPTPPPTTVTPPPGGNGTRPITGGTGTRPAGGLGSPRPPQSTVRPVIGSRPGSTGMAPTAPRGSATGNGLTRPVIGTRPGGANPTGPTNTRIPPGSSTGTGSRPTTGFGARPGTTPPGSATGTGSRPGPGGGSRPGAMPPGSGGTRTGAAGQSGGSRATPAKPLIGKNGVAANPQKRVQVVRAPKSHFGGEGTNRSVISGVRQAFKPTVSGPATTGAKQDEQREGDYRPEGGDYAWTVDGATVRGVVTGGDWSDREHAPGTVARMTPAEVTAVPDERDTVSRLSQKDDRDTDDDPWRSPPAGRGVVARPNAKNEFDFGW